MATERGSLGLGQRLLLFGAWLVSCGFVYVLGVYVGKGLRGDGQITPRVALPVEATVPAPPAADAQAPLTFYDVLGKRDGATPPAAAPAPPRPAPAPPPPAAAPRAALNEQKLPAAAPPPPAPAAPAASPPRLPDEAPKIAAVPPAGGGAAEVVPPAAPSAVTASGTGPTAGAGAGSTASPPPAPATAPSRAASFPAQAPDGRWTVYANPTRDRLAVEHERAALRAKGYPAEVVTLRRDGDVWYRIRVGRYATQAQADEASRRLRSDGVGHAFVQSE